MLYNYLKVLARSIGKQKFNSAINIVGLTVAITFALLIGVFIYGERQVNQNIADVDRLFLIESKFATPVGFAFFTPPPLARAAREQYPAVFENYYRFWDRQVTVSKGDTHFRIQSMIGDSTFMDVFGFSVLSGNAHTALSQPNSIVITAKTAIQFFGKTDVVNQTLSLTTESNGIREYQITAVLKDLEQKNSVSDFMNMDAQVFIPIANRTDFSIGEQALTSWDFDIIAYLKLQKGASVADAEAALKKILKSSPDKAKDQRTLALDAVQDYYLVTNNGAVQKLLIALSAVVAFILILAMSNFVNLSIAGSFSRLKEIGVRKVIGGVKRQVVFQFLSESIAFAVAATLVSVICYELLHNYFGEVLGSPLPSIIQFPYRFWLALIAGAGLLGILAGSYTAFYLSTVNTIESLKGKAKSIKGTLHLSRTLIGLQFLIAILIFTGAVILSQQVSYFLNKDMGYDKSFVMTVTSVPRVWSPEGMDKMESAKREFLTSPRIIAASLAWGSPSSGLSPSTVRTRTNTMSEDQRVVTTVASADESFGVVHGLHLLEGKFLANDGETRLPNGIVINESAQKALHANVGDRVLFLYGNEVEFTVTGIVQDFNFESLHEPIKPVAIMHNRDFQAYRHFSFKLQPGSLADAVTEVEQQWKKVFPNDPFVYSFADERIAALYKTEYQLKKASTLATGLMMIIMLTGVLGLVSLSVVRRTKEIGVRKVLGASASNILMLVSKEYMVLMTIAFVIGVPASIWLVSRWLDTFAYRISLSIWMFAVPAVVLLAFTLLVIGAQSAKAIFSNPVKSLRSE